MRTTLAIDDDVLDEVRQIAAAEGRSVGAVLTSLARRALKPTSIRVDMGFPVFDVEVGAPVITMEHVSSALDDE